MRASVNGENIGDVTSEKFASNVEGTRSILYTVDGYEMGPAM